MINENKNPVPVDKVKYVPNGNDGESQKSILNFV